MGFRLRYLRVLVLLVSTGSAAISVSGMTSPLRASASLRASVGSTSKYSRRAKSSDNPEASVHSRESMNQDGDSLE